MNRIIVLLLILFLSGTYAAAQTTVGAAVEGYGSYGIHTHDAERSAAAADLKVTHQIDTTIVNAVLRAENDTARINNPEADNPYQSGNPYDAGSTARVFLKEGYVQHEFLFSRLIKGISVKAGKILYSWGNADELKPCDILNPQDLSFLLLRPIEERKYGAVSANLRLNASDKIFAEGIIIPRPAFSEPGSTVFQPKWLDDMAMIQSATSGNITVPAADLPDKGWRNMNAAARAGFEEDTIAAHIQYFYGFNNLPTYEAHIDIAMLSGSIKPEYKKIQMFGADIKAGVPHDITLRAECAFFERGKYFELKRDSSDILSFLKSPEGKDIIAGGTGMKERRYADYTAGIDASDIYFKGLNAGLACSQQIIFGYNKDFDDEQYATTAIGTLEYLFPQEYGRAYMCGYYNLKMWALNCELRGDVMKNTGIALGCWIIEGSDDTFYGQFDSKDQIYLRASSKF